MVETTLTPELIAAGERFVHEMEETGLRPDAVFWFYFPDVETWKLVVAEVKLGKEGPKGIYKQLQKILAGLSGERSVISLDDVALAKPDAPIVSLLRTAVGTGPGVSGIRFQNNVVNGTLIEDAYIYMVA
jgi:hypothetical protein